MAPSARVKAAFKAMKNIGIAEEKTKPALKKLLKVFDKNWDLIEEENYRVLADAIFEYEESETAEKEKKRKSQNAEQGEASGAVPWQDGALPDEPVQDEPERPLKRLRLKHQGQDAPSNVQPSSTSPLKIPKLEPGEPVSPQPLVRNKGKQVLTSQNTGPSSGRVQSPAPPGREKRAAPQTSQPKEPKPLPGTALSRKQKQPQLPMLIKPKDEPFTDDMVSVEPLAVVHPEHTNKEAPSKSGNQVGSQDDQRSETVNGLGKDMETMASTAQEKQLQAVDVSDRAPAKVDIAASSLGEVKLSLNCNPGSVGNQMHVPDLEAVLKKVNDNCLKTYKIMNPEFSVTKVMKEFCECVVDLGKKEDCGTPEGSREKNAVVVDKNGALNCSLNGKSSGDLAVATDMTLPDNSSPPPASNFQETYMQAKENAAEDNSVERDASDVAMNLKSIVVTHPCDMSDITGGEEAVKVSLEKSNCEFLPSFHYITKNVISDNADVKFSLAQVGDGDCCLSCLGGCLSSSSSCNCAQRNGGESTYTPDGLVSEEFLDECISIVRNPRGHHLMYCKECPLERLKNEDMLDPCKGHLKRKFIKECSIRCDCSRYCGNRIVQQGIRCNLQVFWTSEGKGWGLRTLDDLPKGAFVCEFVGEIMTCKELYKRNLSRSNDKHSYSMLLDTDWGSRALKEKEFLSLDGTFYGNVARFINHRCTDANLIEIPVEVETPSHHYYHVALFTTRKVNAFEELTWDYGVDFDDNDQHMKAFRCLCGSQFCRNMKRSSRSRSALILQ